MHGQEGSDSTSKTLNLSRFPSRVATMHNEIRVTKSPLEMVRRMEEFYLLGDELGTGADATVRLCTHKLSGQKFACKSIHKKTINSFYARQNIRTEIQMLKRLKGHPNIVSLEDHFEDKDFVHVILELCEGGDLLHRVMKGKKLSEAEAAEVLKATVRAILFCHEKHIMHRDVKLENILLPSKKDDYSRLKVADFGLSADFSHTKNFYELLGTPAYNAPEILKGRYDERVDVWSLGVVLFILLSGRMPFSGETKEDIFIAVKTGNLDLTRDPWPTISAEAKDLLQRMLERSPCRRIQMKDLSSHPWLDKTKNLDSDCSPLLANICLT